MVTPAAARVCSADGCGTILRRSNTSSWCSLHEAEGEPPDPAMPSAQGRRICSRCDTEFPLTREFFSYERTNPGGFRRRCLVCRSTESAARYTKSGRTITLFDAAPAREHIKALKASGMSYRAIERKSGVNNRSLTGIARGKTRRVRAATEAKILATSARKCATTPDAD